VIASTRFFIIGAIVLVIVLAVLGTKHDIAGDTNLPPGTNGTRMEGTTSSPTDAPRLPLGPPASLLPASPANEQLCVEVLDDLGRPISGIGVSLSDVEINVPIGESDTDIGGRAIFRCPKGIYFAIANQDGMNRYYGTASARVDTKHEGTSTERLTLPGATARLVIQVNDDLEQPLPGVSLWVDGPSSAPLHRRKVYSDDRGIVTLDLLVPGRWRIDVDPAEAAAPLAQPPSVEVQLEPGGSREAQIRMPRLATILVETSAVLGGDELQAVTLYANREGVATKFLPSSDGRLVWRIMPGDCALVPIWPSNSQWHAPAVTVSALAGQTIDVRFLPDRLAKCIVGRVTDDHGLPVEGVGIRTVVSSDRRSGSLVEQVRGFLADKQAESDPSGSFRVEGLPDGAFTRLIVSTSSARHRYLARFANVDGSPDGLDITDRSQPVEIKVNAGVRLVGTVFRDLKPDVAVAEESLTVRKQVPMGEVSGWRQRVEVDKDGKFEVGHLGPGSYLAEYSVRHDGGAVEEKAKLTEFIVPDSIQEGETVNIVVGE
jgi:hypothetical protein